MTQVNTWQQFELLYRYIHSYLISGEKEKKKEQGKCGACTIIKFVSKVMCDGCQLWFH